MGNYLNEIENIKDYLGNNTPMFTELDEMPRKPEGQELMTHLRMLYGHVDWECLIVEVDPILIELLRNEKECFFLGDEALKRIQTGEHVALLNAETKGALAYSAIMNKNEDAELLDMKEAIRQAAYFFVLDLFDSGFSFMRFAPYFLIAFRLALLEGEMTKEVRFSAQRVDDVWKRTFSLVMVSATQNLMKEVTNIDKGYLYIPFDLGDYAVEDYLENM